AARGDPARLRAPVPADRGVRHRRRHRFPARRALPRHRRRDPAPARARGRRRPDLLDAAHAAGAARDLRVARRRPRSGAGPGGGSPDSSPGRPCAARDGPRKATVMIARVVAFALHQRFITLALALLLTAGGIVSFHRLPIEAYPDVADVEVDVITL